MKVHNFTIDSSQRNPTLHPKPNDYTVTLDDAIYDVSQIKLVSGRIPTSQFLICETNNKFDVIDKTGGAPSRPAGQDSWISGIPSHLTSLYPSGNYTTVTLQPGNYTGASLATEINNRLTNAGFSYDANDNTFNSNGGYSDYIFLFKSGARGYDSNMLSTTPYQILGSGPEDLESSEDFGAANLKGPNSLVLRISSGSEKMNQSVYVSEPYYTGHILLDGTDFVNVIGADDKVSHEFNSGALKSVRNLRIEFFYMSHGRLIPYDFRNQDHILKFEITCSTDKLENLKVDPPEEIEEKTDISIPDISDVYEWKKEYVYIIAIVVVGLLLMMLMKGKPKPFNG